jgi:hypothetical protein
MTAEERAWAVADQFRDWLQLPGPSSALFNQVVSAMTAAVREAEDAAAARQREADAAVCRAKADEFRELLVDEAVLAALECAAEILAGGGGAGGGTTE